MKIALIPSAFFPSLGGVEELTRQLAHELVRQGHDVLIVTERWPRNLPQRETFEGLKLLRYPMRVPTGHWKSNLSYFLTHRRILQSLVGDLKSFRADVLHAQCVSSTTLYALEAKRRLSLPLVVTLQGELTMDANGIFDKPGLAQKIMLRAVCEADVLTACSTKTLADASSYLTRRDSKLPSRVVFNAANLDDFRSAKPYLHAKPYLFALGRLVPQKGFDDLINAYANSNRLAAYDLIIAGDGPSGEHLQSLVGKLGLENRIHFIGRTDRKQTVKLFLGCEAFILPSRADEGLPVVCAEAMAAGKPIIATNSGGTPEMIQDEHNGLIIAKGDVGGMRVAIERVVNDQNLAIRLASATRESAEKFSWNRIAAEYVSLYTQVRGSEGAATGSPN